MPAGLWELLLVFVPVLGLAVWQFFSVSREIEQARRAPEEPVGDTAPSRPPRHAEGQQQPDP